MNRNEEGFIEALKTLVHSEPEKLAFFNGERKGVAPPPFVPNDVRKIIPQNVRTKRRQFSVRYSLAAACVIALFAIAINNADTNSILYNISFDLPGAQGGGGASTSPPMTVQEADKTGAGNDKFNGTAKEDASLEDAPAGAAADDATADASAATPPSANAPEGAFSQPPGEPGALGFVPALMMTVAAVIVILSIITHIRRTRETD